MTDIPSTDAPALPGALASIPAALFDAIDRFRWGELESLFDEDIIYERPGYAPLRGRAQVMHFYRHERAVAEGRHELIDVAAGNDRISCHGRFVGRSKRNEPLDLSFCDFYVLRDGRLLFRKTFFYVPLI